MRKNIVILHILLFLFSLSFILLGQDKKNWKPNEKLNPGSATENEIVSKRTWNSKTYAGSNGQVTVEISPAHRHYRDEDGNWQDIDFRIDSDKANPGNYAINRALYKAKFGQNAKADYTSVIQVSHTDTAQFRCRITRMGYYDGKSDTFHPLQEAATVLAEAEDNRIYYRNIFDGFDLRYTPGLYQLKEEFVISEWGRKTLPYPKDIGLKTNKLYLVFEAEFDLNEDLDAFVGTEQISSLNSKDKKEYDYTGEESIWFGKKEGKKKFTLTEDWAFYGKEKDILKDKEDDKADKKIWRRLITTTKGNFVYFGVLYDWIAEAPEGELCIDPTVKIHPVYGNGKDAYIYSEKPNDNYGGSSVIKMGPNTSGSQYRGLIQFDLSSIPQKAMITSTEMRLYLYQTNGEDYDFDLEIHKMLVPWTEGDKENPNNMATSGCDWYNAAEEIDSSWNSPGMQPGSDFATAVLGTIPISYSESNIRKTIEIDSTVQQWRDNIATNYGLALISTSSHLSRYLIATFYSSDYVTDTDKCPKLIVSYEVDKLAEFEYDALGRISKISFANGVEEINDYHDTRGWIKKREYKKGETTVFEFTNWAYDAVGNLTHQYWKHLGEATVTPVIYGYDSLYCLTSFQYKGNPKRLYDYDDNGNRKTFPNDPTFGNETFEYIDGTESTQNRLMKYATSNYIRKFQYDASGRLINIDFDDVSENDNDVDLYYDIFNNMTQYVGSPVNLNYSYVYDANNQRIRKTDMEGTRYYIKSETQTIAEYTGNNLLEAEYIYAGSRLIAKLPTKDEVNLLPCNLLAQSAGCDDGNFARFVVGGTLYEYTQQKHRGFNLMVLNEDDGSILDSLVFDTYARTTAADSMADFINSLPVGRIVLAAIKDEGSNSMTEAAYQALESLGSAYCRDIEMRSSLAMIGIKGASSGSVQEDYTVRYAGVAYARLYKFSCQIVSAGHDDGDSTIIKISGMEHSPDQDGYNVVVVNENNGLFIDSESFDTYTYSDAADSLAAYINDIPFGRVVLVAIKDDGHVNMTEPAYLALESLGSALCRDVRLRSSWCIMGIKGAPIGSVPEKMALRDSGHVEIISDASTVYLDPYYVDNYKFFYQDHLGSTRQLSDSEEKLDFYPYGMEMGTAGTETDIKFTGKERDKATDLDYFGARYYMSRIGRWIVPDPLAESFPDMSPYHYCHNNPVNGVDLFGMADTLGSRKLPIPLPEIIVTPSVNNTSLASVSVLAGIGTQLVTKPNPGLIATGAGILIGTAIYHVWMNQKDDSAKENKKKGKSGKKPDSIERIERDKSGARGDRHAHGKGDKWAINEDGTMHDNNTGRVPKDAADYLRKKGFNIPPDRYPLPNK